MTSRKMRRLLIAVILVTGNWAFFSTIVLLDTIHVLLFPPGDRTRDRPAAAVPPHGTGEPPVTLGRGRYAAGYLQSEIGRETSESDRPRSRLRDVIDRETNAIPSWRSRQEIVFLQQLKNLTNTTVQPRKSCTGARRAINGQEDVGRRGQSPSSEKFLLPVMLGNQGPNNQLQAFRFVAIVARERNYTLVLAPFFNHPGVDGLDMRCFDDTLDPGAINRLVPTVTMDRFRERCHGRVDAVVIGTRLSGSGHRQGQHRGLELYVDGQTQTFAEMTGIQIPSIVFHRKNPKTIIDLPQDTPSHAIMLKEYIDWYPTAFQSESRCVAFVYPYGLLGRLPHQEYLHLLVGHLNRPREIRTLAGTFLQGTGTNTSDFICVHWRFNSEWKHFWCPSHGKPICVTLTTMTVARMAERLARLMDLYHLGALYFASPPGQQKAAMAAALKRAVSPFYSSEDITEALWDSARDYLSPDGPLRDQYRLSLLEQEICSRKSASVEPLKCPLPLGSKLFVASELSSWSDNVVVERRAQGLRSVYVMDVLTGDEFRIGNTLEL